jgi:Cu2+-exporting ATPase
VTRRVRDSRLEAIPVPAIAPADELWIVPGDIVPVQGILLGDPGAIALDWITGESDVRSVAAGDPVPAGAFNAGTRVLRVSAQEPFEESRLNDLLRASAADRPRELSASDRRWWHRIAGAYVLGVLTASAAGFALWAGRDLSRAIEVTIAVLVVTCPCALGLATPLAHELVHLALRRRGVFLRDGTFLERAIAVRKVVFDKTGTLTVGRLAPTAATEAVLERLGPEERGALLHMASRSNHPISRALAAFLAGGPSRDAASTIDRGGDPVEETPGLGLSWSNAGVLWRLGRPSFALGRADGLDESHETVLARDGSPVLRLAFDEEIKEDAAEEIARLHQEGIEVHLLSGDSRAKVERAAERLAIDPGRAAAELSPEEKAARIRALDARDTLMVGDGLNDAPAFAAAYCAATPMIDRATLPARADFYFLGAGISAVRSSLAAARRLRSVARGNLAFAAGYNAIAIGLCFAGLVTPLVAAILMPVSSVTVVTWTALRLRGKEARWMS